MVHLQLSVTATLYFVALHTEMGMFDATIRYAVCAMKFRLLSSYRLIKSSQYRYSYQFDMVPIIYKIAVKEAILWERTPP